MSCDWNIRCVTCKTVSNGQPLPEGSLDYDLGFDDANHQADLMRQLINLADEFNELAALLPAFDAVTAGGFNIVVETSYGHIDPMWFARHHGHLLVAVDEYGRLDGQCHEHALCDQGFHHNCKLDQGHDGPHKGTP